MIDQSSFQVIRQLTGVGFSERPDEHYRLRVRTF